MKVVYIGMQGGGSVFFNVSVEEAKRRYVQRNPNRADWDFTFKDGPYTCSAVTEVEIEDELQISAEGLAGISKPE